MQYVTLLTLLIVPGLALAGAAPVPVPEPSTVALFASGAAAAGLIRYLKKKGPK